MEFTRREHQGGDVYMFSEKVHHKGATQTEFMMVSDLMVPNLLQKNIRTAIPLLAFEEDNIKKMHHLVLADYVEM